MAQDLIGLTIHIAPQIGFESAVKQVKPILWENAQINEQFEAVLLNTSHQVVSQALSNITLSADEIEVRVEVVGRYIEENVEEWFAVGMDILCAKDDYGKIAKTISADRVARRLCQALEAAVSALLTKAGSPNRLIVDVEVTSYGRTWS